MSLENLFRSQIYQALNKGGPGSGNFGHSGRPGERGGSSSEGGGGSSSGSVSGSASGSRSEYNPERARAIALKALEGRNSMERDHGEFAARAIKEYLSSPHLDSESEGQMLELAGELLSLTGWKEGDPVPYGMPDVPASVRGTRNDPTSPDYGKGILSEPLAPDARFATLGGQYGSFDKPEDWDKKDPKQARTTIDAFMDASESNGGDVLTLEVSGFYDPGEKQTWDEPGYGPQVDNATFQTRDSQGRYYTGDLPAKYEEAFLKSVEQEMNDARYDL